MRRRDKAGGKAAKTQRRKTVRRRNAPKAGHSGRSSFDGKDKKIAQLTRERDEALEQQTATSEVLQVISRSRGDLQPVFASLLTNAVRICDATFGNIYRWDGNGLHLVATHNTSPAFAEHRRRSPYRPSPKAPLGRTIATKTVVHVVDLAADRSYTEQQEPGVVAAAELGGVRTFVAVPLLKENELIGIFTVYRKEVRPFSDTQIDLLKNFAAQAIIAIENARLLNELRQRTDDLSEALEQQTATSQVLQVISNSPGELDPVFEAMLENATRICQAKFGTLYLYEGGAFRAAAMHNVPPAFAEARRREPTVKPSPDNPMVRVAATKRTLQSADVPENPAWPRHEPQFALFATLTGARSLIMVPMLKDNELVGVITVYRQDVRPFTDKQTELLTNFAAQAVIAIENTRLLKELRESLQQQTATADILRVISSSPTDLKPVLDAVAERSARLCNASDVAIFNVEGDTMRRVAHFGSIPFTSAGAIRKVTLGTVAGRSVIEQRTIHIHDILEAHARGEYPDGPALQRPVGYRTVLVAPLLRKGVAIGAIIIRRMEVDPFSADQIKLLETFADQAVIAIENVRLFESVEARTRELTKSLEELRTAQDRLVQTEKLASLGQLTAGIAHEIKNPLNFVNNFSAVSTEMIDELQEALKDVNVHERKRNEITELMDTLRGNLDKVVQHGKRADSIVKNMLLHSRQGSGEHRSIDINTLVEESLNLAYHGARAEKQGFNITLEKSFDSSAGEVDVFPQEITRVLLNLISNGFYAATKRRAEANGGDFEPTLAAATKNLGDRVEIRIRDNGTGIPPEVKDKMFNPFFTTKPAGEGTGLGLSISHDVIVKQHGGSIEVDTQPGEFTEFKIILPRMAATIAKSGEGT